MTLINFTPGPSQLYPTVEGHTLQAFREKIPSLAHRSKTFEAIYRGADEKLRALLGIPSHFHIFFAGSASEIFERSIQNLVEQHSFHLVNGAFSKRYFEIAQLLCKQPVKMEVEEGQGFRQVVIPEGAELVAITNNETSTGVRTSVELIADARKQSPALISVDAVSSLPYPVFDFRQLDSLFFSVQKAFGMPAGLGVWIVNDRCLEKAAELESKKVCTGSYHSLSSFRKHEINFQTPETPNVLGIYLLDKVAGDFLLKGVDVMRRETEYKADLLYQALARHGKIKAFIKEKDFQSQTVIVADCGEETEALSSYLQSHGLQPGSGYGKFKRQQLRFANFPAHSIKSFELLSEKIMKF